MTASEAARSGTLVQDDGSRLARTVVRLKRQLNVPRDVAMRLGLEAEAIVRRGEYQTSSGCTVSIADAVQVAVRDTQSYPLGQNPRWSDRGVGHHPYPAGQSLVVVPTRVPA